MSLTVRSRQASHPVDAWLLRRLAKWALAETEPGRPVDPDAHALGVFLLDEVEMARANWEHLRHEGPTDVITLDFGSQAGGAPRSGPLLGDIFICPVVAEAFAREHGATWPEEVVRYLIHGVLHLRGYDDRDAICRKRMKREEERLARAAVECFPLSRLAKRGRVVGR
ncbi:MAG: rRNA maturation RNase YbeY [Verrucomicrobiota bacterium]|jgi:probable rRNA maturation factor|nr:rRNA maturation RNase YbeY [Verrucomicrobiota bacterium]